MATGELLRVGAAVGLVRIGMERRRELEGSAPAPTANCHGSPSSVLLSGTVDAALHDRHRPFVPVGKGGIVEEEPDSGEGLGRRSEAELERTPAAAQSGEATRRWTGPWIAIDRFGIAPRTTTTGAPNAKPGAGR